MSYKTKGVIRSQTKRASYSDELKPATLIPIAIQQTETASCMAPAAVKAIAEGLPPGEEASCNELHLKTAKTALSTNSEPQ